MLHKSLSTIIDFLEPVNTHKLSGDEGYRDNCVGKNIAVYEDEFPEIEQADIVLVGCNETRGAGIEPQPSVPDAIRRCFYQLYHWHKEIKVADLGNVLTGAALQDSYAAVRTVVQELMQQGKRVVILGGSHDVTLAQYEAYAAIEKIIEATCVDARIDLDMDSVMPADNFLMGMLTNAPNFIRHYNHIGFQSYLVHPGMLETIDKLRFDCYRAGKVKENIEEMEPVIRNSNLFSFDIAAIQHSHAPCNHLTPNGFTGEEACTLMQYAGMSAEVNTIGIYGYIPLLDIHDLTAKQISQMLWYLMDGMYKSKHEAPFEDKSNFNEYHIAFADMNSVFLQSRKTARWWMQLPEGKYIACSARDYLSACNNDIPERWLRAVERS